MSNAVKILPHYTYEDYNQWEGRWELIDGIPYAMSPLPDLRHQIIATNLTGAFVMQLEQCNCCNASLPVDYHVSDDTILQPDMLVITGDIITKEFPPVLVAEVLSCDSVLDILKNRHTKYAIYQSQGIKYYIIIAPDKEEAEVYELENGKYQLKQTGKTIVHEFSFPERTARIDFKEIW